MPTKVVDTAKNRPGKCALTGDTKGPFLDTRKRIPNYGRIYLSVRGLRDALHEMGFLAPEEAEALREDNSRLQEENRRLTNIEDGYNTLVDVVKPHIVVEPEVQTVVETKERKPTDREIERWIKKHGADHPVVQRAQRLEKGSPEEWRELYGDVPPGHPDFRRRTDEPETVEEVAEEQETLDLTTPTNTVMVHDQEVDLNAVLDQNVGDVLAWAEGHEESVLDALVNAEYDLAREKDRSPRKSLIEGLGYEYDESESSEEEEEDEDEFFDTEDEDLDEEE